MIIHLFKLAAKLLSSRRPLQVKIKKMHPDAKVPAYAKLGDAGLDLTAVSVTYDAKEGYFEYDTGLAVEIPLGYVGLVFPRSSISKKNMMLCNAVGVVDSGYRDSIKLRFKALTQAPNTYEVGERVGQLMILPYPMIELKEVSELSDSERGAGGFGSSGK